ncbi:MAG: type II 3-dehydroquinate dehydratase [Atopobiaceae bacterium]|nr:type II 3-dehydroquinate dehydratase [Atopobiaceae bacterium]
MMAAETARRVFEAVGGKDNIVSNTICMTRLRLELANIASIDKSSLLEIHGVLGCVPKENNQIEIVFGPAMIERIYTEFIALSEKGESLPPSRKLTQPKPTLEQARAASHAIRHRSEPSVSTPTSQQASHQVSLSDIRRLQELLNEPGMEAPDAQSRLLVLNGPNINLLGTREPHIYGSTNFHALNELCREAGRANGFVEVRCFQSNHEGDLIDEIQAARGSYGAIVINAAAFTHTSIAIFDALKAVDIPAYEVHISKLEEREEFRQVSYLRAACIGSISGKGIQGYAEAIEKLAEHLGLNRG